MKHTLLIITAVMLMVGCSKPIDGNKLVYRGGSYYEVNSDKAYSGEVVWYYKNGQKEKEVTIKDGKEDGLWTEWYENGQKVQVGNYRDGGKDGKWTFWYENGQKEKEGTINQKWTYWDENGRKSIEQGTLIQRDSLMYAPGSDEPYSGKAVMYYYNIRQKGFETTYKDGKEDGEWTFWYENGQKKMEGTNKNGEQIEFTMWDEDGNVTLHDKK